MVIGDDVCIAVLWLVDFHVGVFPGKLLAWINRLRGRAGKKKQEQTMKRDKGTVIMRVDRDECKQKHKRKYFSIIKIKKWDKITLLSYSSSKLWTEDLSCR